MVGPDLNTLEGIRGTEFYPPYAQHDVVLPFTRMLANPSANVLKSIPSHWDETVVLPVSEIRQVAAASWRCLRGSGAAILKT